MRQLSLFICLAFALAGCAKEAVVISPVSVVSTGALSAAPAERTIDQSGLDRTFTSGVTEFDTYDAASVRASRFGPTGWVGPAATPQGALTFDLGQVLLVDRVAIWEALDTGFDEAVFTVSTDGSTYSAPVLTLRGSPQPVPLPDAVPGTVAAFSAPVEARFVRMEMPRCPNQRALGASLACGVAEVAFSVLPKKRW